MDPGCPVWCTTGFDNLDETLDLGGAYWHRGDTITVATDDTSVGGNHVAVDVRLEKLVMDGAKAFPRSSSWAPQAGPTASPTAPIRPACPPEPY